MERLQKIMSQAGLGSRRDNELLIESGRVKVNGQVAKPGTKADPAVDRIEVNGKLLTFQKQIYIMLHKPRGVLTSNEDELEQGRQTVRDLVQVRGHLYPVGRLDRQSEGLILLTNDGEMAHKLTHPRFGHEKYYRAIVEGVPSEETLNKWREGVLLDDKVTAPAGVELIAKNKSHSELHIILQEGRKRQIRRVAAMLGHPVQRLLREGLGPLQLGDLPPGQWRYLTDREIQLLKRVKR